MICRYSKKTHKIAVSGWRRFRPRTRSGIEGETSFPVEPDIVLERAQLKSVLIELRAEEVACAAGVSEKVVNGDLGRQVLVGIVGEILAQRIAKIDFAGLHKLQH